MDDHCSDSSEDERSGSLDAVASALHDAPKALPISLAKSRLGRLSGSMAWRMASARSSHDDDDDDDACSCCRILNSSAMRWRLCRPSSRMTRTVIRSKPMRGSDFSKFLRKSARSAGQSMEALRVSTSWGTDPQTEKTEEMTRR